MIFTETDKEAHQNATDCCICETSFNSDDDIVRDHDHITGFYRGAAHAQCNLAAKQQKRMIVYMHNAKG